MSSVIEIEKAILTLPSNEVEKFASWWEAFRAQSADPEQKKRLEVIASTSGCLAGEGSSDLELAVAEAGAGIEEDHEW